MLIFLSFCAIGFSQNDKISAPANTYSRTAELPAAYSNSTATAIGENIGIISNNGYSAGRVPFTGTYYNPGPNATASLLYDNGPYYNVPGSPNVSFLQDASLGMGTYGFGASAVNGYSIADDVTFADDVDITSIDVFAYQTGSPVGSINSVSLQVWDDDPSGGGASIVWGDLTTNILSSVTDAQTLRQLESAPGDTSRALQLVTANTAGLSLTAGTYWIEYTFGGTGASGPWAPPIVITGSAATGNGLQNNAGAYTPVIDVDAQGFPFMIYGDIVGGGGSPCDLVHDFSANAGAGMGSSVDSDYKTAADILVLAGEDFTLDTIEVPFLTFAPTDPPTTANVVYYEDAAGLPGTMIGSETVVPTILSSAPWANPVADQYMTSLSVTPFTFPADGSSDTTYWIEISMGTATNQPTVFWEATLDTPVEGEPAAQFNAADGFWTVPDPAQEVIYTFSGICGTLGVSENALEGFAYYPNPTSDVLSLKSVNSIDSVSIFNILGQKVMDTNIGATTSDINLSGLTAGTYIMKVTIEGQTGTYKVLKN